jgi:tetratricopeptide (TPR) repeat protein
MNLRESLVAALAIAAMTACSRNDIEAINTATEGDHMVKVDVDGAISKYEQATKMDPSNVLIFYKLTVAYEKKEEWAKVASTAATAARLAPKNAMFMFKRGKALRMQAEKGPTSWDEAKDPLEKCIQIDPNFDDCYYQLGEVYLQTDDEQRALENWTKAIQHNPKELIFYAPLAELYMNLGYYDQALATVKAGLDFSKPDAPGLVNLYVLQGAVYQAKGDLANASAALEKGKQADTEGAHPEILFNLGSTYAVMSPPKKQEALQMLKAFNTKACKGAKAKNYKPQCEQTATLMTTLGGGAGLVT